MINTTPSDFDAGEYGGAPFLGISKPVIKAHGSADAKEIKNACRQAIAYVNSGLTEQIAERAAKAKADRATEAVNEADASKDNNT